jgi:uncharacterized protein YybS (DUF2232 family)
LIRNSLVVASVVALLTGSLPLLIISLPLVLVGVIFSLAGQGRHSPVWAGFSGTLVLGAAWLIFWSAIGLLQQVNPYTELRDALDQGLAEALTVYREQAGVSGETWQALETTITDLRQIMPTVLPGLLVAGLLSTVWMNQALGNWLLRRKAAALAPWPGFVAWQLPDNLVWGVILGGLLLLLPLEAAQTIGLNLLIIWGVLYCIQGTAVLSGLFQRWALPQPVRVLLFVFVMIQSFGLMLLAILGLIDVWVDFRKIKAGGAMPRKPSEDEN